jgi:hypothetical protein
MMDGAESVGNNLKSFFEYWQWRAYRLLTYGVFFIASVKIAWIETNHDLQAKMKRRLGKREDLLFQFKF